MAGPAKIDLAPIKKTNTNSRVSVVGGSPTLASRPNRNMIEKRSLSSPVSLGGGGGYNQKGSYIENHNYNFSEIDRASDKEGVLRVSFQKKETLCAKEGWSFVGKNPEIVKYINSRFKQIAWMSDKTPGDYIRNILRGIIRHSNSVLILVRKERFSTGNRVRMRGKDRKPIAGMFYADISDMTAVIKDERLVKWRYNGNSGSVKDFDAKDVIHISRDVKGGSIYGTPESIAVLQDLKIWREVEDYANMYIDRHLFPLYQFSVGSDKEPAQISKTGVSEIDQAKESFGDIASEGTIFTSERHKIEIIESSGKTINILEYMNYYKSRAIMGLGMSEVDFGIGGTSNRGTASVISRSLVDSCKSYQDVASEHLTYKLIYPLMMEGGFDPFDEEQEVRHRFNEIDTEEKRAKEQHSMLMYQNDGALHTEYRQDQGRKPLEESEWDDTYTNRTHRLRAEIDIEGQSKIQEEAAQHNQALAKAKPENQQGAKTKPKTAKNDLEFFVYTELISARQKYIDLNNSDNKEEAKQSVLHAIMNGLDKTYQKNYAKSTLTKDQFYDICKTSGALFMIGSHLSSDRGLPSTRITFATSLVKSLADQIETNLCKARDRQVWDFR